jgi:hypothetical protein
MRRNPGLTLRKAENLSYDRLMRFNRETVDYFLKLLRQTMGAMKLHERLHLIYSVEETGLKPTYSSGNQKPLAVKGSKILHTDTRGEKRETLAVFSCMSASGSNLNLH